MASAGVYHHLFDSSRGRRGAAIKQQPQQPELPELECRLVTLIVDPDAECVMFSAPTEPEPEPGPGVMEAE